MPTCKHNRRTALAGTGMDTPLFNINNKNIHAHSFLNINDNGDSVGTLHGSSTCNGYGSTQEHPIRRKQHSNKNLETIIEDTGGSSPSQGATNQCIRSAWIKRDQRKYGPEGRYWYTNPLTILGESWPKYPGVAGGHIQNTTLRRIMGRVKITRGWEVFSLL